jgi:hypothetical protein
MMSNVDGNNQLHYTSVPRIVRTELVMKTSTGVRPIAFAAYLLKQSKSGAMDFSRIPESKGSAPFADLPNAGNGYRTELAISCAECHGFVRIRGAGSKIKVLDASGSFGDPELRKLRAAFLSENAQ